MPIGADKTELHDNILAGKREFTSRFSSNPLKSVKPGHPLTSAHKSSDDAHPVIYRLRSGWACQFRRLSDGRKAILDIYLPGDVIGLDAALNTRSIQNVVALTSSAVDTMIAEEGLCGLMTHPHIALYVTWLLAQRQRRADRLLTAISSLDARGRLAVMFFDFYRRLHRQKLVSSPMYNLPLTQSQIGAYLGLTVVHVNRVLGVLRQQKIVNLEKHCVNILDLQQLSHLAEDRAKVERSASPPVSPNNGKPVQCVGQAQSSTTSFIDLDGWLGQDVAQAGARH
jgi:CRP/FNR family transcriptional regulator, anaerobic regulatory protein